MYVCTFTLWNFQINFALFPFLQKIFITKVVNYLISLSNIKHYLLHAFAYNERVLLFFKFQASLLFFVSQNKMHADRSQKDLYLQIETSVNNKFDSESSIVRRLSAGSSLLIFFRPFKLYLRVKSRVVFLGLTV